MEKYQLAERSIFKTYRKEIWNPFVAAVKNYHLIKSGDKIAVCISGGKDSMLMAKLLQMLQRFSEVPFELVFLVMDPGYSGANRKKIEENARILNIPITVFRTDIFSVADNTAKNSCYLCARMRRGYLYSEAKKRKCNKIALGHHMNDVIETVVMSMFYGAQLQCMPPMLHSMNYKGMDLIRPLYRVNERDIIKWCRYNNLEFIQCACRFTERSAEGAEDSKRNEIKQLLSELRKQNPNIETSIFNAVHKVNIDTFPGYKTDGELHSFFEKFSRSTGNEIS